MRNAFIDELINRARENYNIFLIVGDLGYSVVEPFVEEFPDRFINAGIAEQNMMGLAAGMASEGYHVFVYSIANFPTFRCAEQIRNDVDYHNLPVTIVSVGGGLAYGNLGYSHHAIQDYGLMRLFPNMLIAAPGDPLEVRACMRYLIDNPGPSYLRLAKAGEPNFHQSIPLIYPGKWLNIHSGNSENTLLTTGATISIAHNKIKNKAYQDYSIHSLPLWGMNCRSTIVDQFKKWQCIESIEDHILDGGFGSWLIETNVKFGMSTLIKPHTLSEKIFGAVAGQKALNILGGIE